MYRAPLVQIYAINYENELSQVGRHIQNQIRFCGKEVVTNGNNHKVMQINTKYMVTVLFFMVTHKTSELKEDLI